MDAPSVIDALPAWLSRLNRNATARTRITREPPVDFGGQPVERYRLGNGLRVLLVEDHRAPVVSYNTWFRVGSRNEHEGKTGLAHLFEHLMFNETKNLPAGRFDQILERAGAETNASTWNDWTNYYENVPSDQFATVVRLEAERMHNLVLRAKPVASEKEVVANERRFRVEDDVDGTLDEALWAAAFTVHPYHHPTIGWMKDILAFTPADCRAFYKTYYAPNNAVIVVVGDIDARRALSLIRKHYASIAPSVLPVDAIPEEPPQTRENRVELRHHTPTEKITAGYKCPALSHPDHPTLSVLAEALTGGRSSRLYRSVVTERELASDVSAWASTFRDPGLWELSATARQGVSADTLLAALDGMVDGLATDALTIDERDRAIARLELSFVRGLETVSGRAEQIGFFDTVLGDPAGGFTRLEALRAVTPAALADVAQRYLRRDQRTVVIVRTQSSDAPGATAVAAEVA